MSNNPFTTIQTTPNQPTAWTQSVAYQLQFIGPRVPTWYINDQLNRAQAVLRYRRYEIGDHDAFMSAEMMNLLNIISTNYSPFSDNYCSVIVQTMVDRCTLQSMEVPGDDAATKWANDIYEYVRMDALQGDVAEATIRDGDAFVMVDWDEDLQQVRYTLEETYDGTVGMMAFYRSKSVPVMDCAIKIWQMALDISMNILTRVNIYYTDHVEKYYCLNQAPLSPWQGGDISIPQYAPDAQRAAYGQPTKPQIVRGSKRTFLTASEISQPTPSTVIHFESEDPIQYYRMADGTPLGIPVIHFRNRGRQNYGYSEIKSAIPIQDAVNRMMYSLIINAEYNGFPLLVARGFPMPSAVRPGTVINIQADQPLSKDETADVTRIQGADMTAYIDALKWATAEMGKITRTPTPEFMAQSGKVSGEALKQLEIGLVGKANRFMTKAGNAWEDVFRMAARIQESYGDVLPPKIDALKANWRSPEIRDDATTVQNALAMRDVVGDAQVLRMVAPILDLDEQGIQFILQEKQDELQQKLSLLPSVPGYGSFNQPPDAAPSDTDQPAATQAQIAQQTNNTQPQPPDVSGANAVDSQGASGVTEAATAGVQEVTT